VRRLPAPTNWFPFQSRKLQWLQTAADQASRPIQAPSEILPPETATRQTALPWAGECLPITAMQPPVQGPPARPDPGLSGCVLQWRMAATCLTLPTVASLQAMPPNSIALSRVL